MVSVACHMYAGVAHIGFARASLGTKEKWPKRPLGSENQKSGQKLRNQASNQNSEL